MPALREFPKPTDFHSTITRLQNQDNQVNTWRASISTQLQICTTVDKLNLYKTLYLLDTFQSNLGKLQNLVHTRIQMYPDKTQTDELHKNFANFCPIPAHLISRPSVIKQLNTITTTHRNSSNINYYAAIAPNNEDMTPATPINTTTTSIRTTRATATSSLNLATKQSTSSVNVVSLKELSAIIDKFTTSSSEPVAQANLSPPDTMDTRYGMRLQLQVSGFTKNAELFVKIGKFFMAAKQADYTVAIRPFQQDNPEKLPNINAEADLQNARDLTKYFHPTGSNQMWSLLGQVHIESQFPTDVLLEHLANWCKNGNHRVSPLQCQTEETSHLGFLLRSSVTIYHEDLKMAIKQHPLWTQFGSFDFGLAVRLLHSPKLSVPTLCIEVAKSQAAQAAEFFTKIYDGEFDELPLGLKFLFFSTYNCAASDNDRNTLAQEQERFLCSERTITIKGLHPLETKVRLATPDNQMVSIRSLLLLLPTTNLVPLFHGIDRQHDPSVPYILAKYPEHHAKELINAILNMDAALKLRTHPDDHKRVFVDVNAGLTFGAEFQNYKNKKIRRIPFHNTSEISRVQLTNILTKINSTVPKRAATNYDVLHPPSKKQAWQNVSLSSAATSATTTSSIATTETRPYIIDLATEPIMQTFETKLAALQSCHQTTNTRIDELDININLRMDTLDSSIQSLVLSSNTNFGLLLEQFGVSPTTGDPSLSDKSTTINYPTTEEMEIDVDSRKREWAQRSGVARHQSKK